MRRTFAALLIALFPLTCAAGGSVDFGQIDRLLKQSPQVRIALLKSLQFPDTGYADVRLGPHFKHLSAHRLGPYSFEARVKGSAPGSGAVLVTLCTTHAFLDAAGKAVPEGSDGEFDATRVRERVTGVILQEATDTTAASCP
jgi:hypothetical protein